MTFYEAMHALCVVNAILASAGAAGWWCVTIHAFRKPVFGYGEPLALLLLDIPLTAMAAFLWTVWYSQLGAL